MHLKSKIKLSKLARDRIGFPTQLNFENTEAPTSDYPPYLQNNLDNLLFNLNEAMQIVSMPYRLTHEHLLSEVYTRNFISARIIPGRDLEESGLLEEEVEKRCRKIAHERTEAYVGNHEGINDEFLDIIIERLNRLAETSDFAAISGSFLRQTLILIWNSFEVFCRDIVEQLLNAEPLLAEKLITSPELRKVFDFRNIAFQTLKESNFDVSARLGSIAVDKSDLSSLHVIKAFIVPLTTVDVDANKAIFDPKLYYLNKCRNLVVHRRGLIDARFKEQTDCRQEVGSELEVTFDELEKHAKNIVRISSLIVKGCVHSIENSHMH